jgi:serine/threonine-protein kinase
MDGAPVEVRAWLDMRGGWDVAALVQHLRPPPTRVSLTEVLRTPVVEPVTGMRLLWVPGGRFKMGSDDLDGDSKPPHWVRVTPFWIGETPVTNLQYRIFVEQAKHREPKFWRDRRFNDPEQPVVGVSWGDAMAFCQWMAAATGWVVDLPSEAQWEFAARGEDGRIYPWGTAEPDATRACFDQGEQGRPAVVGSLPAGEGPFGTLDQAGNVWEFCKDVWDAKAYRKDGRPRKEPMDPLVTEGPDGDFHSIRGGSWAKGRGALAAAYRGKNWLRGVGSVSFGFRVVVAREPLDL